MGSTGTWFSNILEGKYKWGLEQHCRLGALPLRQPQIRFLGLISLTYPMGGSLIFNRHLSLETPTQVVPSYSTVHTPGTSFHITV